MPGVTSHVPNHMQRRFLLEEILNHEGRGMDFLTLRPFQDHNFVTQILANRSLLWELKTMLLAERYYIPLPIGSGGWVHSPVAGPVLRGRPAFLKQLLTPSPFICQLISHDIANM